MRRRVWGAVATGVLCAAAFVWWRERTVLPPASRHPLFLWPMAHDPLFATPWEPAVLRVHGAPEPCVDTGIATGNVLPADAEHLRRPAALPPAPTGTPRVTVSADQGLRWQRRVRPHYPALPRQARIRGIVQVVVLIRPNGSVRQAWAECGHPLLRQAAVDAVRQWEARPVRVDGKAAELVVVVRVPFRLTD